MIATRTRQRHTWTPPPPQDSFGAVFSAGLSRGGHLQADESTLPTTTWQCLDVQHASTGSTRSAGAPTRRAVAQSPADTLSVEQLKDWVLGPDYDAARRALVSRSAGTIGVLQAHGEHRWLAQWATSQQEKLEMATRLRAVRQAYPGTRVVAGSVDHFYLGSDRTHQRPDDEPLRMYVERQKKLPTLREVCQVMQPSPSAPTLTQLPVAVGSTLPHVRGAQPRAGSAGAPTSIGEAAVEQLKDWVLGPEYEAVRAFAMHSSGSEPIQVPGIDARLLARRERSWIRSWAQSRQEKLQKAAELRALRQVYPGNTVWRTD